MQGFEITEHHCMPVRYTGGLRRNRSQSSSSVKHSSPPSRTNHSMLKGQGAYTYILYIHLRSVDLCFVPNLHMQHNNNYFFLNPPMRWRSDFITKTTGAIGRPAIQLLLLKCEQSEYYHCPIKS